MIALQQYRTMYANYLLWMGSVLRQRVSRMTFVILGAVTLLMFAPGMAFAAPGDPTPTPAGGSGDINTLTQPDCTFISGSVPVIKRVVQNAWGAATVVGLAVVVLCFAGIVIASLFPAHLKKFIKPLGIVLGVFFGISFFTGLIALAQVKSCL